MRLQWRTDVRRCANQWLLTSLWNTLRNIMECSRSGERVKFTNHCHAERSEASRMHTRGCSRDPSLCSGWQMGRGADDKRQTRENYQLLIINYWHGQQKEKHLGDYHPGFDYYFDRYRDFAGSDFVLVGNWKWRIENWKLSMRRRNFQFSILHFQFSPSVINCSLFTINY